jgi:IPT/TIG domain
VIRARGLAVGGACLASLAIFASTVTAAPFIATQAVTGVSPNAGPIAGGQQVVITGSGFTGATDVFFGTSNDVTAPCPAAGGCFTFVSDTEIDATTPPGAAGTVDVQVMAGGVLSPINSADQYKFQQPAPTVTGVSPNAGPTAGGSPEIAITGTDFSGTGFSTTDLNFGATDVNVSATFPCSSGGCFQVNSATSISAFPPAGSGQVDITVTTASTDTTSVQTSATSAADTYAYAGVPTVTNVAPSTGPINGGNTVVITGANFESTNSTGANFRAIDVVVDTTHINITPCPGSPSAPCFNVDNAAQITVKDFPSDAAGTVDLTVTTAGGTSATSANDVYTFAPLPTVTGVSPKSGPVAGGTAVTLTGTSFDGSGFSTTQVTVGGTPLTSCPPSPCFTLNSATSITVEMPARPAGTVDITVTTQEGTSATSTADTYAYAPVPSVTNVNPNAGSPAGGNTVVITGTGFESAGYFGPTSVSVGSNLCPVTSCYRVDSPTQITITSMPANPGGQVDITVTTVGGTSATSSNDVYTYVTAFPAVTSLSQIMGPQQGGAVVTITGSGFGGPGFGTNCIVFANAVTGNPCSNAAAVTTTPCPNTPTGPCFNIVSATKISVITPAAPSPGMVDIHVVTPAGTTNTALGDRYTYVAKSSYKALTPFRICDTRSGSPTSACRGRTLGAPITVQITSASGPVMPGAQAVVVNLTAINHSSSATFVSAYPAGGARPLVSNINVDGAAVQANLAVVALSPGGAITIFNSVGSVDVIVDVQGYFAAPGGSTAGEFHSLSPVRICDTRANTHTLCAATVNNPLGGGAWRRIVVSGLPPGGTGVGIPADGTAATAVFNLTAVGGTQATFLSVAPPNSSDLCPTHASASNLNPKAGETLPNRVISPLGPNRDICVFNSVGSVNFIIDVNGWFGTAAAPAGAFFYAVLPTRICDTRATCGAISGPLGGAAVRPIQVAGSTVVPAFAGFAKAVAVVANLTGVAGTASTFLELYPSDAAHRPGSSDLNPAAHDVIANLAVVSLSKTAPTSGFVNLYNSVGSINAILDVAGWFQ